MCLYRGMPLRTDGVRLRQLRELRGMTQDEFAQMVGYSANYVCKLERGRSNAGPRFLRAAAQVFGCEIAEITNGARPRKTRSVA